MTLAHSAHQIPEGEHVLALDTSRESWVGTFPGLGSLTVDADGGVTIFTEDAVGSGRLSGDGAGEALELRHDALLFGWGEPLSFVRRGLDLVPGAALADPRGYGLVLVGDGADRVLLELVDAGWSVLGDGLVPALWSGSEFVAHPREAPVLASRRRAERAERVGTPVRSDTDAVAMDLPRASEPTPVRGVVTVGRRIARDRVSFTPLVGRERFAVATSLVLRGALIRAGSAHSERSSATAMREHLRLAELPAARLRTSKATLKGDVSELLRWWQGVTENPARGQT